MREVERRRRKRCADDKTRIVNSRTTELLIRALHGAGWPKTRLNRQRCGLRRVGVGSASQCGLFHTLTRTPALSLYSLTRKMKGSVAMRALRKSENDTRECVHNSCSCRVAAAVKRNDQMRKGKQRSSVYNPKKKCFNKHTNIPVIKATLPPLDGGFTSASSECSWNGDLLAMSRARGGWSWSAEAEMIACGAWSANVCCASERECGHGMDVAQKVAPLIFGFPPFWRDEVTFLFCPFEGILELSSKLDE